MILFSVQIRCMCLVGSLLCGLGFVSAAVTASLDERGMEQLGRVSCVKSYSIQ